MAQRKSAVVFFLWRRGTSLKADDMTWWIQVRIVRKQSLKTNTPRKFHQRETKHDGGGKCGIVLQIRQFFGYLNIKFSGGGGGKGFQNSDLPIHWQTFLGMVKTWPFGKVKWLTGGSKNHIESAGRWWFQWFSICTPNAFGNTWNDPIWRAYFSHGWRRNTN